jgi:hypothetical protein
MRLYPTNIAVSEPGAPHHYSPMKRYSFGCDYFVLQLSNIGSSKPESRFRILTGVPGPTGKGLENLFTLVVFL